MAFFSCFSLYHPWSSTDSALLNMGSWTGIVKLRSKYIRMWYIKCALSLWSLLSLFKSRLRVLPWQIFVGSVRNMKSVWCYFKAGCDHLPVHPSQLTFHNHPVLQQLNTWFAVVRTGVCSFKCILLTCKEYAKFLCCLGTTCVKLINWNVCRAILSHVSYSKR